MPIQHVIWQVADQPAILPAVKLASEQLLSRAWMIDPGETQASAAATNTVKGKGKEPWNGEFYVSPCRMISDSDAYSATAAP
jgi:hypothetical protein